VPYSNIASGYLNTTWWTLLGWEGLTQVEHAVQTIAIYPALATDGRDEATVVWLVTEKRYGNNSKNNIFANRFVNHQWGGEPVQLNSAPFSGDEYDSSFDFVNRPKVAASEEGDVLVVWMQSNSEVWMNRFDPVAGGWETAQRIVADFPGIRGVSIDVDRVGNAYLVWYSKNRMQTARYSAFWRRWGEVETIVDNPNIAIENPKVKVDSAGNALVVWTQYSGTDNKLGDIHASRYTATSRKWGAPIEIDDRSESAVNHDIAMLNRGEAVVVWESGGDIYATWFK